MNKKQRNTILGIIILALLIYFLNQQGLINFEILTVTPTTGSQDVINPALGKNEWTYASNSFVCDSDECIVSGSMEVKTLTEVPKVLFRTNGLFDSKMCVGYDFDSDGDLDGTFLHTQIGTNTGFQPKYIRSDGLGFNAITPTGDPVIDVGYPNSKRFQRSSGVCSISDSSIIPKSNCQAPELCDKIPIYIATFNFCPSTNPNFEFCSGSKNSVTNPTPKTFYTEEYKLSKGARVDFNPKYPDNSLVTNLAIYVRKYDLSCLPALISPTNPSGTACTPGQIYCKSTTPLCPNRYLLKDPSVEEIYCSNNFRGKNTQNSGNKLCQIYYSDCKEPVFDYTKYVKCESKTAIGQSQCDAFGTTEYSAPTGQECFLFDNKGVLTSQNGKGLGGLSCRSQVSGSDFCAFGSKEGTTGSTVYRQCELVGSCNKLVDKSCPSDLVFDSIQKDCIIPTANSCQALAFQCLNSLQYKKCEQVTISGKNGYQWSQQAKNCLGELKCEITNDGRENNDLCSCKGIDNCKSGEIQCIDRVKYKECSKDPANLQNSCLIFRDLGKAVGQYEECVDNKIQQRSDIGCAFNTKEFACLTTKDSRGILLEECNRDSLSNTYNTCVLKQDQYSATENQYLTSEERCSGNTIEKVEKIVDGTKAFYRWTTKTDAKDTVKGVCKQDFTCVKAGTKASCQPGFSFVGILSENSYGVGIPVNGVQIVVTDNYPGGKGSVQITARLLENGVEISNTRKVEFTNSLGEKIIDFGYSHSRTGQITIEAIAGDPATSSYKIQKVIDITKRLDLKLNCPTLGYVNRDIQCTYRIEDKDDGSLVSGYSPKLQILQGSREIIANLGTNVINFKTDITGGVIVKLDVTREGYLPDSDQVSVSIQVPEVTQVFKVDNQDYSVVGTSLETGFHQFALTFDEAGVQSSINSIQATIREPSGREVPLNFVRQTGGLAVSPTGERWVSSYDLKQAGSNYIINYQVFFTDVAKAPQQGTFTLITLGEKSEEDKGTFNLFLILGAVGVAVLIVLIVIIVLVRRRKKR